MTEADIREQMAQLAASLFARGFSVGSAGNISARVEGGFLITPTNSSLGRLDPRRISRLETRVKVCIDPGPPIIIQADGDQLDQLLINLVRNAADASLETGGDVSIGWSRNGTSVDVWIRDQGLGLSDTANLFVPFFTTKPSGSGIGLALSRQIAEAHDGALTLRNRTDASGCEAHLRLPL